MPKYIDAYRLLAKLYKNGTASSEVYSIIYSAPAENVRQAQCGVWNALSDGLFECSVCRCEFREEFVYCPECGAKNS